MSEESEPRVGTLMVEAPIERSSRRRSSLRSSGVFEKQSGDSKKLEESVQVPTTASTGHDEENQGNIPVPGSSQKVIPPLAPSALDTNVISSSSSSKVTEKVFQTVATIERSGYTITGFSSSLLNMNSSNYLAPTPKSRIPLSKQRTVALPTKGGDPAKCLDRIDDMYDLYYSMEDQYSAKPYMDDQVDINRKMRSILVDWLVDVHSRFKLQPLTLWLTVNILDRYLMQQQTMRSKLQLVGVSAMFIACKYEEIFPPFLRDCVCITDFAYEREDLLAMEKQILITLNYEIFVPTGYHFLSRYLNCISASESVRNLASYYAERNLQEYDSLNQDPHRVAATSLFAALLQQEDSLGDLSNYTNFWCKELKLETGFDVMELVPYAKIMIKHVGEEPETASKRKLVACRKKFSLPKYLSVSTLPLPNISIFDR